MDGEGGVRLVCVLRKDMQLCVICVHVCVYIRGAQRKVPLGLHSLNRSWGLKGSALKGSVSPWVEVIR